MTFECRNVTVSGRRTSVRIEPAMWEALEDIGGREKRTLNDLCTLVDHRRQESGLTASIRMFIVAYFRHSANGLSQPEYRPPTPPGTKPLSAMLAAALDVVGPRRL